MTNEIEGWRTFGKYMLCEVSYCGKGDPEPLLVAPDNMIISERYQGKYLDCFGVVDEAATIWDRNPRHRANMVQVVSKREVGLEDILRVADIKIDFESLKKLLEK